MTLISSSAPGNAEFKKVDMYQHVTDTIIQQLESGVVPWQIGWKGNDTGLPGLPINYHTNNHYKGINIVLLWCASIQKKYTSDQWATFKQWSERKEFVRKGEQHTKIIKFEMREKEVDGEIVKIPLIKQHQVFNRCQLQNYDPGEQKPLPHLPLLAETIDPVDDFVSNTQAIIKHGGDQAAYNRVTDVIHMPEIERFIHTEQCSATENYYATILHELIHWSGAEKRLGRTKGKRFGDPDYAKEELVAELGAAFLCAGFGLPTADKGNHAAYIDNWLQVLRNDKQWLVKAAGQASKAADYLHSIQPVEPQL